jgi:sec-independent protein translocase protein TatA
MEDVRMGSLSIWHWIVVLAIGLLLFGGRGKISDLMGDFAKGIKSFKKGLSEEDKPEDASKPEPMKTIDQSSPGAASASTTADQRKAG